MYKKFYKKKPQSKKIDQNERACRAWGILTKCAKNKETISYSELGKRMTVHHRACRFFLDLIQNYCLDKRLPPLTIVVVYKNRGIPGVGFTACDINNFKQEKERVFTYNWDKLSNPFSSAISNFAPNF